MLEDVTLPGVTLSFPWQPKDYSNKEANLEAFRLACLGRAMTMYQDMTIKDVGVVLAVYKVSGDGLRNRTIIQGGSGSASCVVNVHMITYSLSIHEIVDGMIVKSDKDGLMLQPIFQNGPNAGWSTPSIHIAGKGGLKLGCQMRFDEKTSTQQWSWKANGDVFYMRVGEMMRCRITSIEFLPKYSSSWFPNTIQETGYEMHVEACITGGNLLGIHGWYFDPDSIQIKAFEDDGKEQQGRYHKGKVQ